MTNLNENTNLKKAEKTLMLLTADACNIQHPQLRSKRLQQFDTLVKAFQESESYVQYLESENHRIALYYGELREIVQRFVYVCESFGIDAGSVGGDVFLTADRLRKVRENFPHLKLVNNIPDQLYDWLILDEAQERNPDFFNTQKKAA